ncbi:MAG: hypothetical protein BWY59_01561 [Verrucomicrobia bacterium ADurb.Bin345]|nr:MAG: hypothetical protein BWY59_01561 [Verrucomicrobia bacterium ADurb.Bin345]
MEQVVQIHLPVPLRVKGEGKVDAGEFAGDAVVQQVLVRGVHVALVLPQDLEHFLLNLRREFVKTAGLLVVLALAFDLILGREVELVLHHAVSPGYLVDARGAMPDPLARDEDRQLAVKLEHDVFERRRVLVPQEVVNQDRVVPKRFRALAVGNASRLDDAAVVAHVVHEPDEAVVEDLDFLVEQFFRFRAECVSHDDKSFPEPGVPESLTDRITTALNSRRNPAC